MSIITFTEKNQTKFNEEILTNSHQEHQSSSIFRDTSEIQIIVACYLIFKMFRKIKMNFEINFRISARNNKLK
ncbi:hypothetical protein J2T03_001026 [Chryseobacterium lathyri]|nr:hypothetical protein [Chryseobacterium lathyri]